MNNRKQIAAAAILGLGTLAIGVASVSPVYAAAPFEHYYDAGMPHPRLRQLVDRTQSDLHEAAGLEKPKGDSQDRYHDAQGHLSTFDRKLTKGKFDKGELSKSIDKIKEILDKNILQASSRDALQEDLTNLRIARERRD